MSERAPIEMTGLRPEHWPAVAAIWAEGIATGVATFETDVPRWSEFDRTRHARLRFVAVSAEVVLGWAALAPVSERACYAGVMEVSVYVAERARGRGIGRSLMDALVAAADTSGVWTLQASVFPDNAASLALHEAVGFRVVGTRERIAQLRGEWRDTLFLERRL